MLSALILIFYKRSFFTILILLEVFFLVIVLTLLTSSFPLSFLLAFIGFGAAESSTGLSVAVHVSRSSSLSCFQLC